MPRSETGRSSRYAESRVVLAPSRSWTLAASTTTTMSKAQGVGDDEPLPAVDLLAGVVTTAVASDGVRALDALRVDDPGAGLGIAALLHPGLLPQRGQHQRCRAAHHGGQLAGHSVEVLLRIHAKCLDGGCALISASASKPRWGTPTPTATWTRVGHRCSPTAGPGRTWSDTHDGRWPSFRLVSGRGVLVVDGSPDRIRTGATALRGSRR